MNGSRNYGVCVYTYIHTFIHTHTHTQLAFSLKEEGNLSFVTTWMNLEGIMLSETSQAENDKYCIVSFIR